MSLVRCLEDFKWLAKCIYLFLHSVSAFNDLVRDKNGYKKAVENQTVTITF